MSVLFKTKLRTKNKNSCKKSLKDNEVLISSINAFFLAFLVFTLYFCNIWHINFLNLESNNIQKLNLQL